MPTIKGPIKFGKNLSEKEKKELTKKFEETKVKLPFKATGFKSSKTPSIPINLEQETIADKMLDNYLAQNARTVIEALKEDDLDKDTLGKLYEEELEGKDRKTVLEAIEKLIAEGE